MLHVIPLRDRKPSWQLQHRRRQIRPPKVATKIGVLAPVSFLTICDTYKMNGIGIGTSVGLGAIIGLGIVNPGVGTSEYVATFLFYGIWAGLVFEAYRLALNWKRPFRR
jgi:hypothetical protein